MKKIDILKGISIIAVILYHIGYVKTGYLGVDIFFVINGFLIIPNVLKKVETGEFKCVDFLTRRIMRLMPLLLLVCIISLIVGYMGMLPDDYENLSQSVFASVFFSNNILASLTTNNYWNIVNEYKPLMHTWYLGILMEFYVLLICNVLLSRFIHKILKKISVERIFQGILAVLTVVSLGMYLSPTFLDGSKFYLIVFRLFELTLGGFVGIYLNKMKSYKLFENKYIYSGVLVLLVMLVFSSLFSGQTLGTKVVPIGAEEVVEQVSFMSGDYLLLLTVILTCIILCMDVEFSGIGILTFFGKRSYSLFIWHQILIAFYRYFVSKSISVIMFIVYITVLLAITEITYRFVEKIKISRKSIAGTALIAGVTAFISFGIYLNAGVVRDVPELNITKENVHRSMHAEYVERVFAYNSEFAEENGKYNVLVVGNSFARDWANILLESKMKDKINLSYMYAYIESDSMINKIKQSDYIFSFSSPEEIPEFVKKNLSEDAEIWGIGTKNFGECNGIIYTKRFREDYYKQSIILSAEYEALNEKWKTSWGNRYIDMIDYVRNENGTIRVFTPNHKFISQDCEHLTQEGAKYYAEIIDFDALFI